MIVEKIQAAFGTKKGKSCEFQIVENTFSVRDDKQNEPAYITGFEEAHFTIINVENQKLAFLPIDICIFDEKDGRKCDFAVSDKFYLVLVDIKDYKINKRNEGRNEAKKQLIQTVVKLQTKLDLTIYTVFAVIGLTFRNDFPASKTRLQDAEAEFDDLNTILLEGNSFEFSTQFLKQFHT